MKSSQEKVRQNKVQQPAVQDAELKNAKQPPSFALSASGGESTVQRQPEEQAKPPVVEAPKPEAQAPKPEEPVVAPKPEAPQEAKKDGKVATLRLHADTETADRTKLSFGELMNAQVGHTWISMTYDDPTTIPADMRQPTRALIEAGYGSWGFWPLINRTGDHTYPEHSQRLVDAGLTPGAGTSNDPAHRGFSKNPFKWVPGRVEEPDMAHQPKGTIEYGLNQSEVDSLLKYIDSKRNANYNLYSFNCTTFGVDAVKAAGKSAPSGSMMGVCLPNALYADMYEQAEAGDKSVTLAPLAEGETQGATKKK